MEVTEIKVFPIEEEKLKAFVSIVIDNCFMVNDIKVIKGRDGLFISMPSRRKKNGKFKDVAHPLNNETRQMIEGLILTDYERALRGEQDESPRPEREERQERREREEVERVASDNGRAAAEVPPAAEPLAASAPTEEPGEAQGKSLEEVTELHLRDSFWSS